MVLIYSERQVYKARMAQLAALEQDILVGMLLGDAHLCKSGRASTARLQIDQGAGQAAFVDHLFAVFSAYSWMERPHVLHRRSRKDPTREEISVRFYTFFHPIFGHWHDIFYRPQLIKDRWTWRKVIPDNLPALLTPRALAYQIMCDGSPQKGKLIIHTEGFTVEECDRYVATVNSLFTLGAVRRLTHRGDNLCYPIVSIYTKELPRLRQLIRPYMLPIFAYKLLDYKTNSRNQHQRVYETTKKERS